MSYRHEYPSEIPVGIEDVPVEKVDFKPPYERRFDPDGAEQLVFFTNSESKIAMLGQFLDPHGTNIQDAVDNLNSSLQNTGVLPFTHGEVRQFVKLAERRRTGFFRRLDDGYHATYKLSPDGLVAAAMGGNLVAYGADYNKSLRKLLSNSEGKGEDGVASTLIRLGIISSVLEAKRTQHISPTRAELSQRAETWCLPKVTKAHLDALEGLGFFRTNADNRIFFEPGGETQLRELLKIIKGGINVDPTYFYEGIENLQEFLKSRTFPYMIQRSRTTRLRTQPFDHAAFANEVDLVIKKLGGSGVATTAIAATLGLKLSTFWWRISALESNGGLAISTSRTKVNRDFLWSSQETFKDETAPVRPDTSPSDV